MSRLSRRSSALALATFVAASSALAVTASPALADNEKTLTVVGTSDVFDSNLVQSVIKPGFEAANPGITLNYVSRGTGAAIAYAEAGSASALIVHAASLENQFVDQGYSLEQYGRAIFWGDYVLLGPQSDPAGVLTGGTANDIVGAFEKVAAAGAAGNANFVSRGGTPGTTVQEHLLWALSDGVPTCTVSDLNGGGTAPSTTTGDCPTTPTNPDWYHTTGLTQGPNIQNADACNYTGGNCYVFTDRGTYQYLKSQGSITSNLRIVTRNNAAGAPGGTTALVNSFHAYGINSAKFAGNPNVKINTTGARKFLSWITSPAAQSAIGAYLANDTASGGAPFIPDAAPRITTTTLPGSVAAGSSFTLTAAVRNVVPGTPALVNKTVSLLFTPSAAGAATTTIATAKTNSLGKVVFTVRPTETGKYSISTKLITQIEDDSLTPPFGDLLVPTTTPSLGKVKVT